MLRTVPVPVETFLVVCRDGLFSLEPEGDVDAMKHGVNHETGSAALALPHLRRRHSRPCSSGDAGVQFRSNEFSLCGRTDLRNDAAARKWVAQKLSRQR